MRDGQEKYDIRSQDVVKQCDKYLAAVYDMAIYFTCTVVTQRPRDSRLYSYSNLRANRPWLRAL